MLWSMRRSGELGLYIYNMYKLHINVISKSYFPSSFNSLVLLVTFTFILNTYDCACAGYSDNVLSHIEALEEQFDVIHDRLVTDLTDRGTPVEQMLQALTQLPLALRLRYQGTIHYISASKVFSYSSV